MIVTKTANICILTLKFAKSNRVYPVRVCLQTKLKAPSFDDAFTFGGEEETRTPAPVTRPTPLAGAPRHQLEYFSEFGNKFIFINLLNGGEEGIRTLGSCESLVFKTSSLNRSDTSPKD